MKNTVSIDESVKRQITDSISKNLTDSDLESSKFYLEISKTYRKSMNLTETFVKSTKKSCCKNKYRTFCEYYQSFLCMYNIHVFIVKIE